MTRLIFGVFVSLLNQLSTLNKPLSAPKQNTIATMRLSGLQKEVLSLYRNCLRECRKKPEATRKHFQVFAR